MTELRAPHNVFQQIAALVQLQPSKLNMHHYHTTMSGDEATSLRQMESSQSSHCLIGLVLLHTPGGLEAEVGHKDPLELANDALEAAGKPPLPWGIVMGTEQDALRLIHGRAAEERDLSHDDA